MNVGIYSRIHESSSFTCNDRLKDFSKKKKKSRHDLSKDKKSSSPK